MIVECQRHDDYQNSIRWLLGYLEEYVGHAQHVSSKGQESHDVIRQDPAVNQAFAEIRTLLERFANGKSFNDITERINVLYDDANQDENLRAWFKEIDASARR